LLDAFGIPTVRALTATDKDELHRAARETGFPLVLKTANPTIAHKSDVGGVVLDIADEPTLARHYGEMSRRLGPAVTVQPMATAGVEVSFGLIADRLYGPVVMVSAGGELIELISDRVCALAPVAPDHARRLFERLAIHPLLAGVRGRVPVDIDALARAFSRFSTLATVLADELAEVDVNPILVNADGCLAVDALVVGTASD
jgi:succinyl-CoA synthetase beta subunit